MRTELGSNIKRMEKCSRFENCNVPKCPLDEFVDERTYLKGEQVCTMEKQVRTRLGKDLKTKGLFPREIAGKRKWENMKPESMQKFIAGRQKHQFTSVREIE